MPRVLLAFEPPDGGVAECVAQLAVGAGAHGWDVEAAGPPDALPYAELERADITTHRLPFVRGYGRPAHDARALRGLLALLRSGRYDVVHLHSAKAGVLGRIAAPLARVPMVYSPHSFPFVGEFGAPRRIFATAVEWLLGRLDQTIVCVCEAERREALARHITRAARLVVVLNGSPPCDAQLDPDPALIALRGDGVLAAAVTVLREQKSVDVLIDAVPQVLAALPQARVAVVGDGGLRDQLVARARDLGLADEPRFAFLPFRAPAARHLLALDVYVLPSAWEALPIGALEALACGTPQVVTDVGGTSEAVVPETGIVVPPRDPGRLAEALIELLADADRRAAMSRASRERHARLFAVDRMVAETVAVWERARR